MEQVKVEHSTKRKEGEPVSEMPKASEKGEQLKAELDALLDEIDSELDLNEAQEFVKSYVQKGGQ